MKEKIIKLFKLEWKPINWPFFDKVLNSFGISEKIVLGVFVALFLLSAFGLLMLVNSNFLVEVPAKGGTINEGIVGSPRFINPILATTDADKDLVKLIYSGLMRNTSNGELIEDLAESYSISEDGLTYTFKIKDSAVFHDGSKVTSDDVVFTVNLIKEPTIKSPKRASWDGVTVNKIDDRTVEFVIREPYSPFIENTTIGILPKNKWQEASFEEFPFSQLNTEPIGSGPFKIDTIKRNRSGIPESYTIQSFDKYTLGEPFIDRIKLLFYANEDLIIDAFNKNLLDSASGINDNNLDKLIKKGDDQPLRASLPRVFGIFFNQNQKTLLTDANIREALNISVDRERIIREVLNGYGEPINGPIPPSIHQTDNSSMKFSLEEAGLILDQAGWIINKDGVREKDDELLYFNLSTSNIEELKQVAKIIEEDWQKIGVVVDLKFFEASDLSQSVIRPRNYDSLLFGEIVGKDIDFYAFWHSSQRNDPGLNIAQYANITTDGILEKARQIQDRDERIEKYLDFQNELVKDVPAIFLFTPDFLYFSPKNISDLNLNNIVEPNDRFNEVYKWYISSDRVWKFLTNY